MLQPSIKIKKNWDFYGIIQDYIDKNLDSIFDRTWAWVKSHPKKDETLFICENPHALLFVVIWHTEASSQSVFASRSWRNTSKRKPVF